MKATLNIAGLERQLEELYQELTAQIRTAHDQPTDAEAAANVVASAMLLEGIGQVLRLIGQNIEEPEARKQFLKVQQRFNGFKGATRGATNTSFRRMREERSKN